METDSALFRPEIDRNSLVGERVRFYRTARKLSLTELAQQLPRQLTPQMLANYETAKSRWPADLLCEIAVILALDIRLLLGMEDCRHERKDSKEWEAEKYKIAMLELKPRARHVVYQIIDSVAAAGF